MTGPNIGLCRFDLILRVKIDLRIFTDIKNRVFPCPQKTNPVHLVLENLNQIKHPKSKLTMRYLHTLIILVLSLKLSAQVTLPNNYISKHMPEVEKNKPENRNKLVADANALSNGKLYWFPTVNNIEYFDTLKTMFLQNNIIAYNDSLSNLSLYSELASDFLGPVRISAGITLAYPKSDTNTVELKKIDQRKFLQRFSTGGGTVVFNFILPIAALNSKLFSMNWSVGPRFSIDPPSFGVSSGKFAHNTAMGTDLQAELRGIKNVFKLSGAARLSYIAGNSTFYNALQLTDDDRKGFWLNSYTIGVNIQDIFTLSYTKFWGSKNIADKLGGYLTFTVSPNFK